MDTHDPESPLIKQNVMHRKRSKVVEIVATSDVIFGLTQTGICTAFHQGTKRRICYLNIAPGEVIRSLFYNKANDSIITVSVYKTDNFSSLKCRSTAIKDVLAGNPSVSFPLFETESLRWPGFVEFDDVNGKVLTYSATDRVYKVWELQNYSILYALSNKNIQEIKISPGIMLLIFNRSALGDHIPLKIVSIETGEVLKSFKHKLNKDLKIDFIEQFNEKLLVKQENSNLQILDVRNPGKEAKEVNKTDFLTPSAFIFLYENQLFLTFRGSHVSVWNFKGELVTTFEDHELWHQDCNTNNIYITGGQDLIISYCKDGGKSTGSINISNILNGKRLAKINCSGAINSTGSMTCGDGEDSSATISTDATADGVTALFYNEEKNEIYTGNKHGMIHSWSN
jgi:hypothetical protein